MHVLISFFLFPRHLKEGSLKRINKKKQKKKNKKKKKNVRLHIQNGRYDKFVRKRLFWKFYNTISNDTY